MVFTFPTSSDVDKFVPRMESLLEQYIYSYEVVDDGKTIVLHINGLKTTMVWQVRDMYFYMN